VSCRSSEPQYVKAKSNDRQGKRNEPNSIVLAMAKKEMPSFLFAEIKAQRAQIFGGNSFQGGWASL
jgi:hypothetical protein